MANQGLKVVISGDTTQLNRAFKRAGDGANRLEGQIGDASTGIGNSMKTAAKVGTAAFGVGLAGVLKESVDAFREAEKVAAQTRAVIKSTGGAANLTAKDVGNLSGALSRKSGVDDEAIQSGANLLLTFTKVRNETGKNNKVFDQATSAALDMSVAMGTDMKSAAMQLGKALNDPEKGVTKLARSGVQFTEQQKEQITTLQKSGDMVGAQRIILKELETQFGGSAKAAGDTFAGKIGKAEVAVGNLAETIGGYVAPALATLADKGASAITAFAESDVPRKFFEGFGDRAKDAKDAVGGLLDSIGKKRAGGMSLGASIGDSIAEGVGNIDWASIGQTMSKGISGAVNISGDFAKGVQDGIGAAMSNIDGRKMLGGLLRVVAEAINALFSPSFWVENFAAIFTAVTIFIPIGKILKIPGASTLYRFLSKPLFAAIGFLGKGLINLGGRAAGGFINALVQAFPRATAAVGTRLNRLGQVFSRGANGIVSRFGRALGDLAERAGAAVARAVLAVGRGTGRLAAAGGRIATAMVARFARVVADLAERAATAVGRSIVAVVRGAGRMAAAGGRLAGGLLRGLARLGGDMVGAFNRALISGARKVIGWVKNFASSGRRLAAALVGGIIAGITGLPGKLKDKVGDAFGALGGLVGTVAGIGDGIGKKNRPKVSPLASAGGPSGSLMGADSALKPFASIGAGMGLQVTSGRRPGAITSSNNQSWHSTGEALDLSGPPSSMLAFFKGMKAKYGSRLAELIYTPGGAGIKNGQSHTFSGQVASDHFDHVHIAMDVGKPGQGIGDGIGRKAGTGDGYGKTEDGSRGGGARKLSAADIFGFFRSQGFTAAQSAAWVGNFQQESGLDPGRHQMGGGPGRGFAQWGGSRFTALQAFAKRAGRPWQDGPTQLAFVMHELRGSESAAGKAIRSAKGLGPAVNAILRKYERAGIDGDRMGPAREAYNRFKNMKPGGGGGGGSIDLGGGGGGSTVDIGALRETEGARVLAGLDRKYGGDKKYKNYLDRRADRLFDDRRGRGFKSLGKLAGNVGRIIENKETAYAQLQRGQDQSEEDLGTEQGRKDRLSEIAALRVEKTKQLARQQKRARYLKAQITKLEQLLRAGRKKRDKAKGVKRAKITEGLREYDTQLTDLKAELLALGVATKDTELDIGDLDKDAREVAATPNKEAESGPEGPEPPSTTDKLGDAMSLIDLRERAGKMSAADAQAQRISVLSQALGGAFGGLSERDRLQIEGDLLEAQKAQSAAVEDNTSAIRELKKSIDEQNAIASSIMGVSLREAQVALADLISGQLGGRVGARSVIPAGDQMAAY